MRFICVSVVATVACVTFAAPANELYPELFGFNTTGDPKVGPDPLSTFTWDPTTVNITAMQRYEKNASSFLATPGACVDNAASLVNGNGNATFITFGRLRLDFAVEHAAWFEFFSPDLAAVLAAGKVSVKASISEYNEPYTGKTKVVIPYDGGLFRLVTNSELYEGARFAWIMYEGSSGGSVAVPWTITGARIVAQVKPLNYTGNFMSSDPLLTTVWGTGAYSSRLNTHEQYFGSILMDRGDRVSIQGDGHPTMAAALAAFASPEIHRLVRVMLNATDSGCKGCSVVDDDIMEYPVLWTLSVHDWLWSSGDSASFLALFSNDVAKIIDNAVSSFLTNPGLNLMGWDDRLGNGWCFLPDTPCGREPQITFAALLIMAVQEFSAALGAAGDAARAATYAATATNLTARLHAAVPLNDGTLGVHSASMFLNVKGLASAAEAASLVSAYLNDSTSICSWSPFNSFWILQGLGNAGELDRAAEMAAICWGGMTRLTPGCFWELFEPMWELLLVPGGKAPTRPSYCHPWSNGVTAWLSRALGGLNPIAPGYGGAGYVAVPHVSANYPSVLAMAATASGSSISINASWLHGARIVVVTAPSTPGIIGLPMNDGPIGCSLTRLLVNGADTKPTVLPGSALGASLTYRAAIPSTHIFSPSLPPGTHTVVGEYSCASPSSLGVNKGLKKFPVPTWSAISWGLDYSTRGAWQGVYGKDGYYFYAFDTNATGFPLNVASLPSYANGVKIHNSGFQHESYTCLGTNSSDPAFLADPRSSGGKRLGFVSTGGDGSQGVPVMINLTNTGPPVLRKISIYFSSTHQPTSAVDSYQNGGPSMVLRVMDLNTLNPIIPDMRIDHFEGGVYFWVTIRCGGGSTTIATCGARVRAMQIDGTNTVSAVFFDTPPS